MTKRSKPRESAFLHEFSGRTYASADELMEHADAISKKITSHSTKGNAPLTEIEKAVLQQLETHRTEQKVVAAIHEKTGTATSREEVERTVRNAMSKLRRRNLLPKMGEKKAPRLRTVTPGEIQEYKKIAKKVFDGGKFGPVTVNGTAAKYIPREELDDLAWDAIEDGLAKYDETKGMPKVPYLQLQIASKLADEIRRRAKRPITSLDEAEESKRWKLPKQQYNPDPNAEISTLIDLHSLHRRGIITSSEAAMWVLTNVHGHRGSDLSKHFGITQSYVSLLAGTANRKLAAHSQ